MAIWGRPSTGIGQSTYTHIWTERGKKCTWNKSWRCNRLFIDILWMIWVGSYIRNRFMWYKWLQNNADGIECYAWCLDGQQKVDRGRTCIEHEMTISCVSMRKLLRRDKKTISNFHIIQARFSQWAGSRICFFSWWLQLVPY